MDKGNERRRRSIPPVRAALIIAADGTINQTISINRHTTRNPRLRISQSIQPALNLTMQDDDNTTPDITIFPTPRINKLMNRHMTLTQK